MCIDGSTRESSLSLKLYGCTDRSRLPVFLGIRKEGYVNMEGGRRVRRTALQWLNEECNNDMLRRGNAMYFKRLCDLACAYNEGLRETALPRWRVETICDEKGVF